MPHGIDTGMPHLAHLLPSGIWALVTRLIPEWDRRSCCCEPAVRVIVMCFLRCYDAYMCVVCQSVPTEESLVMAYIQEICEGVSALLVGQISAERVCGQLRLTSESFC